MDMLIDFVTENYIWLIIVGVIILMAIVGYIADKTDFGRNSVEKQPKEKKEKIKKEKVKKEKVKKEKVVEELPIEENTEIVNNVESAEQPTLNEYQDYLMSDNNIADNQVDESLFEPLPSIDQVFNEQPVVEQDNAEITSEPININLESEVEQSSSENDPEDDIWKF